VRQDLLSGVSLTRNHALQLLQAIARTLHQAGKL
jgi:hypothetical protein